jgi:hypothetical protein
MDTSQEKIVFKILNFDFSRVTSGHQLLVTALN